MVLGLCDRFGALPDAGGVLDQTTDLLRMARIMAIAYPGGGEP